MGTPEKGQLEFALEVGGHDLAMQGLSAEAVLWIWHGAIFNSTGATTRLMWQVVPRPNSQR